MRVSASRVARRVVGLAIAAGVASAAVVPWTTTVGVTAQAASVSKVRYKLATGVTMTRIRYANTPNEVRVLTVLPQRGPRLDVVAAGSAFPMYKLTSGMAAGNDAIAGVNGDFATRYGAPVHTTLINGELWTSGSSGGPGFAVTPSGANAYVGQPKLRMFARLQGQSPVTISEWNVGSPSSSTIHAYSERGGTGVTPPGKANPKSTDPYYCAVRLNATSGRGWSGSARTYITQMFRAKVQACQRTPLSLGTEAGNIVLASKSKTGTASSWIKSLTRGTKVRLSYGFSDWPGVTEVIGGTPMLVQGGKNIAPKYYSGADNLLWYNPRTSVGINRGCRDADPGTACKIWVVTVDGRQGSSGWSKGMQLPRLAEEFRSLGARWAMNLDGGASTAMWLKKRNDAYCLSTPAVGGCLVNKPSSSNGERVTISGLNVLPTVDAKTPSTLR